MQSRKQARLDEMIERRDRRLVQTASAEIQHHDFVGSRIHQIILQLLKLVFDGLLGIFADHIFA